VYYQGAQCGTIREYSDTLLIFLLKAKRPEEFREETFSPKQFVALFEQMLDILRSEAGEEHASRVAERFKNEALGSLGNGRAGAPVAADREP
jgi:hypothetical protein